MLSTTLPRYSERSMRFHDLRDDRVFLKSYIASLGRVNNALLDSTIPVEVRLPSTARFWEKEEWDEFQRMSAEERRPIIESLCRGMVEDLRQAIEDQQRHILALEKYFNDQEPKGRRKNLGGRMFVTKTNKKMWKWC